MTPLWGQRKEASWQNPEPLLPRARIVRVHAQAAAAARTLPDPDAVPNSGHIQSFTSTTARHGKPRPQRRRSIDFDSQRPGASGAHSSRQRHHAQAVNLSSANSASQEPACLRCPRARDRSGAAASSEQQRAAAPARLPQRRPAGCLPAAPGAMEFSG